VIQVRRELLCKYVLVGSGHKGRDVHVPHWFWIDQCQNTFIAKYLFNIYLLNYERKQIGDKNCSHISTQAHRIFEHTWILPPKSLNHSKKRKYVLKMCQKIRKINKPERAGFRWEEIVFVFQDNFIITPSAQFLMFVLKFLFIL
jgi:hypothetical protein